MTNPLYADLRKERYDNPAWWVMTRPVIHRFANFLVSTGARACGLLNAQVRGLETQAVHRPPTGYAQVGIRFCAQLGGP